MNWQYSAEYADQLRKFSRASALLCKECTLLVRIQLSKKNANHPDCASADSLSTVMRGAMISLTPCIAPTCERECDLHEYAEFKSVEDMIEKLNDILSKPRDFPAIPPPKEGLSHIDTPARQEAQACVMCPEQDCEALVYMSDQNTSMVEALGLHDHPFWRERVEYFYKRFNKFSKTSKDAWTWEEGKGTSKWSAPRGSSKRHQSVPVNPADRPDPAEKGLPWRDIGDLDTSYDFLYPDNVVEKCPVEKQDQLSTDEQVAYMQ